MALRKTIWFVAGCMAALVSSDSRVWPREIQVAEGILNFRKFHDAGVGSNFLDVVVVSAGFTADQMSEFHEACEQFTKALLSTQPWDRYRRLVNVHAVFVEDESPDVTRLKVAGHKGGVLGCDNAAAVEYARYAANAAATVVIHNSTNSRGGTGTWGVVVINKKQAATAMAPVHELGHGMAGIGDEYIQRNTPFEDDPKTLWNTINVTATSDPKLCKWHYWTQDKWPGLFGSSPLPPGRKVANFEGAGWIKGIYRPEESCFMRCNCDAFCVVCNEAMESSFFRYIDLFQIAVPTVDDVVLWAGEHLDVRLKAIDLLGAPPAWLKSRLSLYLDGRRVACSDRGEVSFRIDGATSGPGVHQLGANLNVQSQTIRRDFGWLSRSRSWRVTVLPYPKPVLAVTAQLLEVQPLDPIDAVTEKPVVLRLHARAQDGEHLLFQLVDGPTGVELNRDTGELSWVPRPDQAGPVRMRFGVRAGSAMREIDVLFRVRRAATPSPVSYCNTYIPQTLAALQRLQQHPAIYGRVFETLRVLRDRYEQIYQVALVDAKRLYQELDPQFRLQVVQELLLHAWDFTDKPDVLNWLREIATADASDDARLLLTTLDQIDGYNLTRTRTGR